MYENKVNKLNNILFRILMVSIAIVISSAILSLWVGWFIVLGVIVFAGDLLVVVVSLVPVIGQVLGGVFKVINDPIRKFGRRLEFQVGCGITLFLHFGLKVNLLKLLVGLFSFLV